MRYIFLKCCYSLPVLWFLDCVLRDNTHKFASRTNQSIQGCHAAHTDNLQRKRVFQLALFMMLSFAGVAQNDVYVQKIREGDSFFVEGRYSEAGESYSAAFQSFHRREILPDRLKAVRAWSMAGNLDSAYFHFFRIAGTLDYGNLDEFNSDKYLQPMRKDERWLVLNTLVERNSHSYANTIIKAKRLLESGDYTEASKCYSAAFQANGGKGNMGDLWDAAQVWSTLGKLDSLYFSLLKISEVEINNSEASRSYKHILDALTTDTQFRRMRKDKRWPNLLERLNANYFPRMPELASKLNDVFNNDQRYRVNLESLEKQFGRNSAEVKRNRALIHVQDSINLAFVTGLLEKYGWLGAKEVGWVGNSAIFLVIHHASLPVMEKYLPMIREAVKTGKAKSDDLALFEDRLLLWHGKKQIYGSQFTIDSETGKRVLYPIEDVDNVDKRRAMVGLRPLSEYAEHFGGIIWDAEAIEKNRKALPSNKE